MPTIALPEARQDRRRPRRCEHKSTSGSPEPPAETRPEVGANRKGGLTGRYRRCRGAGHAVKGDVRKIGIPMRLQPAGCGSPYAERRNPMANPASPVSRALTNPSGPRCERRGARREAMNGKPRARCGAIARERQRREWPRAAATRRAHGGCGRIRRGGAPPAPRLCLRAGRVGTASRHSMQTLVNLPTCPLAPSRLRRAGRVERPRSTVCSPPS